MSPSLILGRNPNGTSLIWGGVLDTLELWMLSLDTLVFENFSNVLNFNLRYQTAASMAWEWMKSTVSASNYWIDSSAQTCKE